MNYRLVNSDASQVPLEVMGEVNLIFTHPPAKGWDFVSGKLSEWYKALAPFGTVIVVKWDFLTIPEFRVRAEQAIESYTKRGNLVVDPFCGESNVGDIALQLNRRYLGIDISDSAIKRSMDLLGAYS